MIHYQSEHRSCDKRPIMFQDLTPDHHNVPSLLSVPPDHLSQFIINYNVSMPAGQDTAWCEEKNCYSGINQSEVTILQYDQSELSFLHLLTNHRVYQGRDEPHQTNQCSGWIQTSFNIQHRLRGHSQRQDAHHLLPTSRQEPIRRQYLHQ